MSTITIKIVLVLFIQANLRALRLHLRIKEKVFYKLKGKQFFCNKLTLLFLKIKPCSCVKVINYT